MKMFDQPEDLCIEKGKRRESRSFHIHYIVILSRPSPRHTRETTIKSKQT